MQHKTKLKLNNFGFLDLIKNKINQNKIYKMLN